MTLDTLRQLMTRYPEDRLSASAFQSSPLFDNILMNSIKFLDSFPEKTKNEKSSFLRGFVSVLPQFSDRIKKRKVDSILSFSNSGIAGSSQPCAGYGTTIVTAPEYFRHNSKHVATLLFRAGAADPQNYNPV